MSNLSYAASTKSFHCKKEFTWSIMKANGHPVCTIPSITSCSSASSISQLNSQNSIFLRLPYLSSSKSGRSFVNYQKFLSACLRSRLSVGYWLLISLMSLQRKEWLKKSLSSPKRLSVHSASPYSIWPISSGSPENEKSSSRPYPKTVNNRSPSWNLLALLTNCLYHGFLLSVCYRSSRFGTNFRIMGNLGLMAGFPSWSKCARSILPFW